MHTPARPLRSERAFIVALAAVVAATAWGAGAPFVHYDLRPAAAPAQRAIVMDLGDGMETLVVSMTYSGPPGKFAWILPVPAMPAPGMRPVYPEVAPASEAFLRQIFTATAPKIVTEPLASPTPPGPTSPLHPNQPKPDPPPPLAEVVDRPSMQAGPYQVTILPATKVEALTGWLDGKDYRYDDAVVPLIDAYVGAQWCFVAVQTEAPAGTGALVEGALPPLAIRFPKPKDDGLVYPLMFSKAGARKWTVVDMVLVTPGERDCDELPAEPLDNAREWRDRGIFQILSDATDKGTKAVALWQSRGVPVGEKAWCVSGKPRPAKALAWGKLRCRRLWMKLRRDQLRDLHFDRRERALVDFSLEFVRQGKARFELVRPGGTLDGLRKAGVKALIDLGVRAGATAVLVSLVVALGVLLGFVAVVYLRHFTVPPGAAGGVVLALALGLAMWGGMRAYSAPAAGSGWMAWDQATAVLDREMRLFVECFGVHPRRVDDMMSPHPQWGEDGSGNAVDLTGAAKKLGGKWRPLAPKDLPVDPATGSRHTWVVDPSAPMWLRSKGLRTTAVIQAPTPTRR